MTINYKYNEGDLLRQITDYVNSTYDGHYSQNQYQATEFIIDGGHGIGFTIGNIMKYAQRYGHKGTPEDWRKDLMKVIHYAIIALYVHDKEQHELDFLDLSNDIKFEPITLPTLNLRDFCVGNDADTITINMADIRDETCSYFGTMYENPLTTTATNSITNADTKKSKKKKD